MNFRHERIETRYVHPCFDELRKHFHRTARRTDHAHYLFFLIEQGGDVSLRRALRGREPYSFF